MSVPVSTSVENPDPLCSICLEGVSATCGRPVVTLLCSHVFHLDCIGSAFNVTGIMQCPNCRQIQKGDWLLFDTRDSESEMEQNFNQDVGDQEPETLCIFPLVSNGEWLCFENRDSETDMEQNFNQDVEDQEPETVSVDLFSLLCLLVMYHLGYMAAKKSPCKEARAFDLRCVVINDALVQLHSGVRNVVSIVITNRSGVFSNIAVFLLNLNLSSLLSNCNLVVNTPLSNCNSMLPSVGRLQLPLQFIRNTLLG